MYHVLFRTCYHYDGQPHGQTLILLLNIVMLKSIFWYLDGGIRLLVISSFLFCFHKALCYCASRLNGQRVQNHSLTCTRQV